MKLMAEARYTAEQIHYIKTWYSIASSRTIAKRLHATDAAIRSLARRLGLPTMPDDCMGVQELAGLVNISNGGCRSLLWNIHRHVLDYGVQNMSVFTLKGDVRPLGQEIVMGLSTSDHLATTCGFRPLSTIRKRSGISSAILHRFLSGELKGSPGTKAELFSKYSIRENMLGKRYAILLSELSKLSDNALQELGYDVSKARQEKEIYQTLEARIQAAVHSKLQHRKKSLSQWLSNQAGELAP